MIAKSNNKRYPMPCPGSEYLDPKLAKKFHKDKAHLFLKGKEISHNKTFPKQAKGIVYTNNGFPGPGKY